LEFSKNGKIKKCRIFFLIQYFYRINLAVKQDNYIVFLTALSIDLTCWSWFKKINFKNFGPGDQDGKKQTKSLLNKR